MSRYMTTPSEDEEEESLKGPTMNLVLVNVGFYVITTIVGKGFIFTGGLAIVLFGFSLNNFFAGLIWTPITSIFAHASIPHLGGNMLFLFLYGFNIEDRGYTAKGIYFSYFVTGILASFLSAPLLGTGSISLGASGAVFGLLGVNTGIERKNKDPNYKKILFASIILFILSSSPRTNVFAHLFGLIIGIIIGNSEFFERFKDNSQFQ